jgi:hypothetical protein
VHSTLAAYYNWDFDNAEDVDGPVVVDLDEASL